jgi:hypothetical protein
MNRIASRFAVVLTLALSLAAFAGEKKQYVIVSPHTADECVNALDEMAKEKKLEKWSWGCMDGDHSGYLVTSAESKEEALSNVPTNQRSKARVVELNKFTVAQVKSFHQGK